MNREANHFINLHTASVKIGMCREIVDRSTSIISKAQNLNPIANWWSGDRGLFVFLEQNVSLFFIKFNIATKPSLLSLNHSKNCSSS